MTTQATFPTVALTGDGLRLSHLVFDARHPDRTRAALGLAVQGAARRRGVNAKDAGNLPGRAVGAVVEANLVLLAAIEGQATAVDSPAAGIVADAARAQARIMSAIA
jgi:hypothetical protein